MVGVSRAMGYAAPLESTNACNLNFLQAIFTWGQLPSRKKLVNGSFTKIGGAQKPSKRLDSKSFTSWVTEKTLPSRIHRQRARQTTGITV